MHFEFLIEDQSGKTMLELLLPRLLNSDHSYRVISYKGIGRIPKNLHNSSDPSKRILLAQLPRLLAGYKKTFAAYPMSSPAVVIVVCDLDDKDENLFRKELEEVVAIVASNLKTAFCIAIEEGEAWFLGDLAAIRKAYPKAKSSVLDSYINDSICGTWELLADALFSGGARQLNKLGYQEAGLEKSRWSKSITPNMNIEENKSPSFNRFCSTINDFVRTQD